MRLVVGMTGATGSIYGIRLLTLLTELGVTTSVVLTRAAVMTIGMETDYTINDVHSLASEVHSIGDIGATIASGSYRTHGMVVAPCSIKTLSGIVNCYEDNLLLRAAGVSLKEGRRLVLMVRETPLHRGHLRLMLEASKIGATVFPPVPAFYTRPGSLLELVDQTCARVLDQFGFEVEIPRWEGSVRHARPAEQQNAGRDGDSG